MPLEYDLLSNNTINKSCLEYLLIETASMSHEATLQVCDNENTEDHEQARILSEGSLTEEIGYNIGLKLVDYLLYLQKEKNATGTPKFDQVVNIMKFVCKNVWESLFGRQIDNLRTNHRGTYVLVDRSFTMISRLDSPQGVQDTLNQTRKHYLWYPCGIIRGLLDSLDIDSTVQAEVTEFPSVSFHIQTSK
ncbi:BA75_03398T0 [Komagataella pastoris]|uniref:BA75_03398T0 n=1 Tax=Komagataella pastoris TaxID=4922 RepID=A0A1B2JEQ9_PICPA|nr:BA75_03398T0 [Komagataella pastoris]